MVMMNVRFSRRRRLGSGSHHRHGILSPSISRIDCFDNIPPRPRLLSLTSSRHLSSPATLIHHITARLDRMEVEVEPIIVDEGNRGKSDSCFLLLTPFVTARSFSPRTTATVPSLTLRPFRFLQSLSRSPRRVAGVACFLFGDGELVFRRKRN